MTGTREAGGSRGGAPVSGSRVLVVGLARSGRAAVDLLLRGGATVAATDLRLADELELPVDAWVAGGVELVLGAHPNGLLDRVDLVVVSPGVPSNAPLVADARRRGLPVIGELELAYRAARGTWLAVTGTNGKTTTTALLGELVRTTGRPVVVAGNIGVPLSREVQELPDAGFVVAEVSSFQLETIERFRPRVAVLLNLTEDHLDRYSSFDEYVSAKLRIFENQTEEDIAVLNVDDPIVSAAARDVAATVVTVSTTTEVSDGVFVRGGAIVSRLGGRETVVLGVDEIGIPGPHNLANAAAALAAACSVGVEPEEAAEVLRRFAPLPHRTETVAEIDGVLYVNDSKATNVESVRCALVSFGRPIVLIAGGQDKGSDFSVLGDLVRERVKAVVLIGEAAPKMADAFEGLADIETASSMRDAVATAAGKAAPGDVVLLSPGCASFDMFRDYEDRGRRFKHEVTRLRARRSHGGREAGA